MRTETLQQRIDETAAHGRCEVFEYPADPRCACMPIVGALDASRAVAMRRCGEDPRRLRHGTQRLRAVRSRKRGWPRKRGELSKRDASGAVQEGRQAEREAQAAAAGAPRSGACWQAARAGRELCRRSAIAIFASVEQEVVKLALAVAARILRREAQMDPLLLTGAVRVALGQLSASTQVRLRVPAAELELVDRGHCALAEPGGKADGDCRRRNAAGRLRDRDRARDRWISGVRAQLGEIERGFFDRAGGRSVEAAVRGSGAERSRRRMYSMTHVLSIATSTRLERGQPWRWRGQVLESVGQTIESAGPLASVGECCEIRTSSAIRIWPR